MKNVITCQLSLLLALLLAACTGRPTADAGLENMALRHATNLTCQRGEGYSLWTLRNPWDTTATLHRYLLVHQETDATSIAAALSLGQGVSTIKVPVRKAGVATAVHCGLLDELGVAEAIAGVCEKQYIDLPAVTRGLEAGTIADFGNGMNPNIEKIMDASPDVLLLTPFEHSGGYGRVERLGIPIVECAEYMEISPLARAEWIRFYAELFGAEAVADSIFSAVENNYQSLKQRVLTQTAPPAGGQRGGTRPTLLTEMLYGGQWFVPCGQSTMGIMFADAGANYLFANRSGSGSTALAFETVLDEAQDADIWLLKFNSQQPLTYRQLAQDYQPYTRFRAFRQRRIYGCDLARNHFYEQTPFHPDRLLRDLIIILHPQLMPGEQTVYYQPLSE